MKFVGAATLVLVLALAACSPVGEATPNPVTIHTPTNLTSSPGYKLSPSWSPDGRRIAFESQFLPSELDIYVMNADGSGLVRLTNNPARDSFEGWSPDGLRIAFTSDRDGNEDVYNPDIYIVNVDGSGLVRLTDGPGWDDQPSWSPDGQRIAFVSDRDSNADYNSDIYIVNVDGSGLVRLTDGPGFDRRYPSWSPDGRRIAFTSDRDGNEDIYTMNTDGSGLTRLTPFTVGFTDNPRVNYQLNWSPDGQRIAFTSKPAVYEYSSDIYNLSTYNSYIYMVNADGSGLTRLTDSRGWDYEPSWSPDGRHIAFTSERDDNSSIYSINADGSDLTRLTDGQAPDSHPSWSPDGRRIAFVSDRDGTSDYNSDIYIVNVAGDG